MEIYPITMCRNRCVILKHYLCTLPTPWNRFSLHRWRIINALNYFVLLLSALLDCTIVTCGMYCTYVSIHVRYMHNCVLCCVLVGNSLPSFCDRVYKSSWVEFTYTCMLVFVQIMAQWNKICKNNYELHVVQSLWFRPARRTTLKGVWTRPWPF